MDIFSHSGAVPVRIADNQWRSKKSVMWVEIEFYESEPSTLHLIRLSHSYQSIAINTTSLFPIGHRFSSDENKIYIYFFFVQSVWYHLVESSHNLEVFIYPAFHVCYCWLSWHCWIWESINIGAIYRSCGAYTSKQKKSIPSTEFTNLFQMTHFSSSIFDMSLWQTINRHAFLFSSYLVSCSRCQIILFDVKYHDRSSCWCLMFRFYAELIGKSIQSKWHFFNALLAFHFRFVVTRVLGIRWISIRLKFCAFFSSRRNSWKGYEMGQQKAEEEKDKVEKNTHLSRERENQQSLKRVTQCGYSFLVFLLDVLYKRHRIISLRFPFFDSILCVLFDSIHSVRRSAVPNDKVWKDTTEIALDSIWKCRSVHN